MSKSLYITAEDLSDADVYHTNPDCRYFRNAQTRVIIPSEEVDEAGFEDVCDACTGILRDKIWMGHNEQ
jgi:hypothetical protein